VTFMKEVIHHWWIPALRAALALALAAGIFLLQAWAKFQFLDAVTIPFLLIALSIYGILDSFLLIFLGMQFAPHAPHAPARTISVTQGFCGVAIGLLLLTILFRAAEIEWFVYLVTAQAAVTGIFELLAGLRFTSHVRDEWACFAAGAVSLGFSVLLQMNFDGSTRHALDWFLAYALMLGASMGWFSYRLHSLDRKPKVHHATA
jgi:hypothetical protein